MAVSLRDDAFAELSEVLTIDLAGDADASGTLAASW
jgi:hypothetical protein